MVRSNWIAILALGFTWANGALGQEPRLQPVAQTGTGERTMTVQEMGKPARKCRVLQEWHQANGSMAYKVQAIDTGEYLTIAENHSVVPTESIPVPVAGSAKPMVLKTMATHIYHWSNTTTPPAGAPLPPETPAASAPSSCNCGSSQTCNCQESMATSGVRPLFPRLRQALTGRDSTYPVVMGEQIILPEPVAQAKPAPTPATPAAPKPAIQPVADRTVVNADDWRKSWGQPAEYKIQATAKVPEDKSTPQKTETAGKVPEDKSTPKKTETVGLPPNSVTETQSHPDPLISPEKLAQKVEEKLATPKPSDFHPFDKLPSPPPPDRPVVSSAVSASSPSALSGKIPMGARSVLAAGSGPNTVTYLPVPVVTVPLTPPPLAPAPALPVPPANPMYVNAFTPAAPLMTGPQASPMAQPPLAYGQSPYLPAGYTPSPYPPPVPSPYVPGQNMGQSPYYAMGQTMGSPYPSNTPPAALPQQRPPAIYQGPTPPNPFAGESVTPVVYTPPPMPTVMVNAAMDRRVVTMAPVPPPSQEIRQLTTTLRASIYPSQREVAAEGLANYDGHEHPEAVEALVLAAHADMAPLVRATCVHCLVKIKAHGEQVQATLATLRNDTDPRVRQEVEQALVALSGTAR